MEQITTEVHFAQRLACNEPKLRERTLKKVGKYLAARSVHKDAFSEDSLLKLWKGLFYYFWNADKPLVQEEKAEVISGYIHVFKRTKFSFLYIDTFFQTMVREWESIDRYRIEKFMMFIRKFLHETYKLLKCLKWEMKWVKRFRKIMRKTVISTDPKSAPIGLKMHISDIYMEELAKVGSEDLTPKMTRWFLIPYCRFLIESDERSLLDGVSNDVFLYLINQDADTEEYHEFPLLQFDASSVQKLLMKYANFEGVRKLNMRNIYKIVKQFEDYKNGLSQYDKIAMADVSNKKLKKDHIEKATLRIIEDEAKYREGKKINKKAKRDAIEEIPEELLISGS